MRNDVLAFIAAIDARPDVLATAGYALLERMDRGAEYIPVPADLELAYFRAVHKFAQHCAEERAGALMLCAEILSPEPVSEESA